MAEKTEKQKILAQRLIEWRKAPTIQRLDNPTDAKRARSLGYKAKKGYVIVVVKIMKGARHKRLYGRRGRKPKKSGLVRFTFGKGLQRIAEERAAKKYVSLQVLNSWPVGEDGKQKWFEVILVDPLMPEIKNDRRMKWISSPANRKRVQRGLTSAGKKARGMRVHP
jgi:large subunit ribosomal protein L15e